MRNTLDQTIERYWGDFLNSCAFVNGIIVLLLAAMISTDVLVRWATGRPIVGVFEFAEILFVPVIFIVISHVQFTNRQLRVDVLSGRAHGGMSELLRIFDLLAGLCFFGILLWTSSERLLAAVRGNYLGMGMIAVPTAIPIGFLVLGTLLLSLTMVLMLLQSLRRLISGSPGE